MLVDSGYQRKNILKLIRHKVLVSSKFDVIALHLDELVDFPDYEPIIDNFSVQNIIKIMQRPEEKEIREMFESFSAEEKERARYISYEYNFFVLEGFDKYYDEVVGGDRLDKYQLSEDDLFLKPSSYNASRGILSLTPFLDLAISQQGRDGGKPRVSTQQCKFMEKLFSSSAVLNTGLSYADLPVRDSYNRINEKKVKKYKNLKTEINKKFTEVTGLKKLILFKDNRYRINPLYLQKN